MSEKTTVPPLDKELVKKRQALSEALDPKLRTRK